MARSVINLFSVVEVIFGGEVAIHRDENRAGIFFRLIVEGRAHTYRLQERLISEGFRSFERELWSIKDSLDLYLDGRVCL